MKRSAQLQKGVPHPSCGRNGSALITMVALFRTYHGSLVWGKPGYEHILVFGGLETTGVPMTELGVITLNGEIPPNYSRLVSVPVDDWLLTRYRSFALIRCPLGSYILLIKSEVFQACLSR